MLRSKLALLAAMVSAAMVGCTQCDTCDDFPVPCTGPNCGYQGDPGAFTAPPIAGVPMSPDVALVPPPGAFVAPPPPSMPVPTTASAPSHDAAQVSPANPPAEITPPIPSSANADGSTAG
ncbi:hypothetical protein [Singulisphaera sp. PoT]|uniref:hypothetical protein n=1 Tax=Singulisphaera sp. PoT TaxID=3411797 RepID=UPI003BF4C2E7